MACPTRSLWLDYRQGKLYFNKASEASGGELMCYAFSLENAVAHLSVTDPSGILTIEK